MYSLFVPASISYISTLTSVHYFTLIDKKTDNGLCCVKVFENYKGFVTEYLSYLGTWYIKIEANVVSTAVRVEINTVLIDD